MKRLLCIIDSLNAGGAETFLMKIGRCTNADEWQFDFIVSQGNGVYTEEVLKRGGKIYEVPPRRKHFLEAFCKIKEIIKINNYSMVLKLGDSPSAGIDLLAAKLGGACNLGFRSCNALIDLPFKEKAINFIARPILNHVANIKIAPSMLAAQFTFGNSHSKKAHIIHNGVDLGIYHFDQEGRNAIRKEFGLENKLVVGHIGRFHKQKNHEYLLDVFVEIRKKRRDAVLLLVGEGELENDIRDRINELKVDEDVIFTGLRFDIPQILSAMDIFIFPSLHEGLPNTIIEAQATGLPCLIADTITNEANITGLVEYLPITIEPEKWADKAISNARMNRKDTSTDFKKHGYEIHKVSKELLSLFDK